MTGRAMLWPPLADEEALFERIEQHREQRQVWSAGASPQVAALIGANRATWPTLAPGTALSLARAGAGPEQPVTQAAARGGSRGFGLHWIGDIVSGVGEAIGGAASRVLEGADIALGGIDEAVAPVVRGAVRAGMVAFETPLQETKALVRASIAGEGNLLSGDFDEWVDAYRQSNTSTGRIVLDRLLSGDRVDLGEGWLSGGEVREQFDRESAALKFPGTDESITLGRHLARHIFEPGSKPYSALSGLVDLGFELAADPTAWATAGASKVTAGRRLLAVSDDVLEGAGAINAVRRAVRPRTVEQWLTSEHGRGVVRAITEERDFDTLWNATRRRIDVGTTARLADARTEDEVLDVLRPVLGVTVRERPVYGGAGYEVRRRLSGVRLLQSMPGTHLDLNDADAAVETLDDWMRNARFDESHIAELNGRMARAKSRGERFQVLTDAMTETAGVLEEWGLSPADAKAMTTLFRNSVDDLRRYAVDEIGENMHVPGAIIDGAGKAVASPHLFVEYLERAVPLPDVRDVRAATSLLSGVFRNPAIQTTTAFLDSANTNWKRLTLLRGAYTIRVIGEEQARMAASGLDSLFSHPLSAIAWATGRRGGADLTGEVFADASKAAAELDDFGKALNRGWAGWLGRPGTITTRHKVLYARDAPEYSRAWADELMQLRADPVASAIAGAENGLDDVKDAFWSGDLAWVRDELRNTVTGLSERRVADQYIDSVWERIQVKTQGDPDLLDALATGMFGGTPLREGDEVSRSFVETLDLMRDVGPARVKGDLVVHTRGPAKWSESYDKATQWAFSALMTRPTNYLSRSPSFRQYYWTRSEELLPFMNGASQKAAIAAAKDAGLPRATLARMREAAAKATGDLTLEQADTVAKAFGLDETRRLLYDLTRRSQFFDAARLAIPFGEAWKELGTTWARIGLERPQTIRRGQQLVEGARGSGFFRTDPATGEEMFTYPGSELVTKALLGVPVPLRGRVAGLSLMTGVLPGVGPVVQIPAGALLPNKPEFDRVRGLLFPFGERDTEGGLLESLLPPWMQKFLQSMGGRTDERLYDNTVADVQRWLYSTGRYDISTPEGMAKLTEDAIDKAEGLYAIVGAAQFFAPSAPSPEFLVLDENGDAVVAQRLVEEYQGLVHELEGDTSEATRRFLDRHGEGALLLTQSKSSSIVSSAPITADGLRWARTHSDVVDRFPNTYGFFAPAGGEFDYAAYARQFETGEREPITPEQATRLANNRLASAIYDRERDLFGPNPNRQQAAYLRQLRQALIEDYPGYRDFAGLTQRADTPTLVRELVDAADVPALARTDAGQALRTYLVARSEALTLAEQRGLAGFGTAASARDLRDWLRDLGDALSAEHPAFGPLWDLVLSQEMAEDETTTTEREVA